MSGEELEIIDLNLENIDTEHICCAIGNDKKNKERAKVKKAWLKERFPEGHTFKKFNVRGKVFIEFVPAEYAWFPIEAPGYMFIQCFWASGRYKGQGLGAKLLEECEKDSNDKNGIVAITSNKKRPFMVGKKYYLEKGFEVCDTANPFFELVVKKYKKGAPTPHFTMKAKEARMPGKTGLTFMYSDLCPYTADWVDEMIEVAGKYDLPCEKIKIESLKQAKDLPVPWGIFSLFYNGEFLTYEVMTDKKFDKLLSETIDL